VLGSKLFPPLAGLAGAIVTLSYMAELTKRQWGSALILGVVGAYLATPIASLYLRNTIGAENVPNDGSVEGLIGLMIGMVAIHIVSAITMLGKKFSSDPLYLIRFIRNGGKE